MKILWVDDEIEGFKPHIMFLEQEGIEVVTFDHPMEALKTLSKESFDLILLDYRMPGLDGLETLKAIKKVAPHIPVALLTMVTDRDVMEESVAEEVFDYLVKPVQPSQILALIKRLQTKEIKQRRMGKKLVSVYQELSSIPPNYEGWLRKARLFADWRLDTPGDENLLGELSAQNIEFSRWIERNYTDLLKDPNYDFSHNILEKNVFPLLDEGKRVALFVFDNFRLDQFIKMIRNLPSYLRVTQKDYIAILPTATPYARNAIFAGQLPIVIERRHPNWLLDNRHERELFEENLKEKGFGWASRRLVKINSLKDLQELQVGGSDIEAYVINFLDLLSHLRQDIDALKELAASGEAFMRWSAFVLEEADIVGKFTQLAEMGYVIFLTSDHGWVEADTPVIIHGGGELTRGLRYKFGDSVRPGGRGATVIHDLEAHGLPRQKGKGRLALAINYAFFVYPSDPHRFEKVYTGGIYHGGISLEEMVIPLIRMEKA